MNRNAAVRWGISGVLALALVLGAFVGGMRVGGAIPAAMNEAFLLQTKAEEVDRLARHLALLDEGSDQALREQLNVELEGELFALCTFMNTGRGAPRSGERPGRPADVVRRVAQYRLQHPPAYPAAWAADQGPTLQAARERVGGCLKTALERSPRN